MDLKLRRSFLISYEDFLKVFSHVFISSIDYGNLDGVKHEFITMVVPSNLQQATHFYLKVFNPCALDLSVVQSGPCMKDEIIGSVEKMRFLKAKILVAR